jgi:hypothetical protein
MLRSPFRLVLSAVALTMLGPSAAWADQGAAPAPRPAFDLAQATVSALAIAEDIEELIARVDRNRLGDPSSRFEGTNAARQVQGLAQKGANLFNRPLGASGDPVRRSATGLRAAFTTIAMQMNDAVGQFDKLATAESENDTSDAVRALTAAFSDERAWQMLQQATRDVLTALTTGAGGAAGPSRLALTRAERETVLAGLTKAFPRLGTNSRGGGNAFTSAALVHELLTRPAPAADE